MIEFSPWFFCLIQFTDSLRYTALVVDAVSIICIAIMSVILLHLYFTDAIETSDVHNFLKSYLFKCFIKSIIVSTLVLTLVPTRSTMFAILIAQQNVTYEGVEAVSEKAAALFEKISENAEKVAKHTKEG